MSFVRRFLLGAAVLCVLAPGFSKAQEFPRYEMWGAFTDLSPHDVDYFNRPVYLIRTADTSARHFVNFQVARYVRVCDFYRRVCVRRDRRGRCVAWRRQCVRWVYRAVPVEKRIQLFFRDVPELAQGEEETYRLDIIRQRPGRAGEDLVRTFLKASATKSKVRIRRINDFRYDIEAAR